MNYCKVVKHFTSDDSDQSKYSSGCINLKGCSPGSKTSKEVSTLHNVDGPRMNYILQKASPRQLCNTKNICEIYNTVCLIKSLFNDQIYPKVTQ